MVSRGSSPGDPTGQGWWRLPLSPPREWTPWPGLHTAQPAPEHVAFTQPGPAGLSCGLQHGLCLNWLGSPASSPHTRATSLKVNETLWLPVVLTRGSHASLCVSVCVCVLLVFFFQMTKSVTNPEELGGLASQMTSDYGQLALQGQLAAATAEPEEVCHLKSLCLDANPH